VKNILVIHYSQSGQLSEILDNLTAPIKLVKDVNITSFTIEMEEEFPFPWTKSDFLDAFPESFLQKPKKIKPIPETILSQKYDLIILGYQVWYLSPSIPINSFLKLPEAKRLLANTPVVTVIGCRNMWVMAQEKLKTLLGECNAKLVGNIVLVDRHINHISVITIVKWMLSGVKKRYLGIFPKPGVSQKDINEAGKFGTVILNQLLSDNLQNLQERLLEKKAVVIKSFLVIVDKRANLFFSKWAKLIDSKGEANSGKRQALLRMFSYYLLFVIWVIAPIAFILFLLTYIPFYGKLKEDKKYYSSINVRNTRTNGRAI